MPMEDTQQIYESYLHNVKAQEDQGVNPFDMTKCTMHARLEEIESILDETVWKGNVPLNVDESLRDLNIARAVYAELQNKPKEKEMYMEVANGLQKIMNHR